MADVKRANISELRELGVLHEVNRLLLHPLGLALEVVVDGGNERLGGVWDYRDDPEGIYFGPDLLSPEKARRVRDMLEHRAPARRQQLGYIIQPALPNDMAAEILEEVRASGQAVGLANVYEDDRTRETYVWVCDKCGQPLADSEQVCNSAVHVGPDDKPEDRGRPIKSTDLAQQDPS